MQMVDRAVPNLKVLRLSMNWEPKASLVVKFNVLEALTHVMNLHAELKFSIAGPKISIRGCVTRQTDIVTFGDLLEWAPKLPQSSVLMHS